MEIEPLVIYGSTPFFSGELPLSVDVAPYVLSMDVSLSMDSVSQITVTLSDPGLYYLERNIFQLRRWIFYKNMKFEIARVNIKQGSAGEEVTIECRSLPCQQMKREKGKGLFTGGNPTVYAATKAREHGMKFFGENTPPKENISQSSSDTADESVWEVLKKLASDNQYVLFETDNRLFFTSQQFLLGKFAAIGYKTNPGFLVTPIRWRQEEALLSPYDPIPQPFGRPILRYRDGADKSNIKWYVTYAQRVLRERLGFDIPVDGIYGIPMAVAVATTQAFFQIPQTPYGSIIDNLTWAIIDRAAALEYRNYDPNNFSIHTLECPDAGKSDDDFNAAEINIQVTWDQGRLLRPGMTIRLEDVPDFITNYLVTEVKYKEGTFGAVSVSARTPIEPLGNSADAKKKRDDLRSRISLTGGGFANVAL